jgi:hypothetical protein
VLIWVLSLKISWIYLVQTYFLPTPQQFPSTRNFKPLSRVLIRFSQFYSFPLLLFKREKKNSCNFHFIVFSPTFVNEYSTWLHEIFLLFILLRWLGMLCVNKYIVIIFLFNTYKNNFRSVPYYYVFNTEMIASVKEQVEYLIWLFMLLNKFSFLFRKHLLNTVSFLGKKALPSNKYIKKQ